MDNVLLLNSGSSVVQLDTTDSGPASKRSKQIVKYSGLMSQIKGVLSLKLFCNIPMDTLPTQVRVQVLTCTPSVSGTKAAAVTSSAMEAWHISR